MGFDMLPKMHRTKLGKLHSQKNLYSKKRSRSESKHTRQKSKKSLLKQQVLTPELNVCNLENS